MEAEGATTRVRKPETLEELAESVAECARSLFRLQEYRSALAAFTHCVALKEHEARTSDFMEWRGAMLFNMASCFHHLGERDAARAYYDHAASDFASAARSDTNQRRQGFVNQRLELLEEHCKPQIDTYLDSDGFRRTVLFNPEYAAALVAEAADLCGGTQRALLATVPNALSEQEFRVPGDR